MFSKTVNPISYATNKIIIGLLNGPMKRRVNIKFEGTVYQIGREEEENMAYVTTPRSSSCSIIKYLFFILYLTQKNP